MDGGISLERFRDLLATEEHFPDEDSGIYHTLAGFLLYHFGYIPKPSEQFDWGGFRFEVMDMDGNRIDRVLVTRLSPAAAETASPPARPA